jgi:hypothetical protein
MATSFCNYGEDLSSINFIGIHFMTMSPLNFYIPKHISHTHFNYARQPSLKTWLYTYRHFLKAKQIPHTLLLCMKQLL